MAGKTPPETVNQVLNLKAKGESNRQIGVEMGLSASLVGRLVNPARMAAHKVKRRNSYLRTTVNGVRKVFTVKKRPWPGRCELCERNVTALGRIGRNRRDMVLYWHHWDDDNLEKGIWLCRRCHSFAGLMDCEEVDFVKKYLGLKEDHHYEIRD